MGERRLSLDLPEASTLKHALGALPSTYPGFEYEFHECDMGVPYAIFLNEKIIKLEKASRILFYQGDRLLLFLPVAGGHGQAN
jgi:hypothetical protein